MVKHLFAAVLFSALVLCIATAGFAQSKVQLGPAPGTLIDIGGHKLHINCVGPVDAMPTIVFEAGGGAFSKDWTAVQSLLAARFRTCAYDRAGLGWSEPGPATRTMRQEVFELHTLLGRAGVAGRLILVGQSMGALNVRLYTEQYGTEVAGVVLIDPTNESSMLYYVPEKRWMKLRDQATGRTIPPPHLTGPESGGYRREDDYLGEEAQSLYLHREQNPNPFGDRPLFVLAAGKRPLPPGMTEESYRDLRLAMDRERAETVHLSRNSKFLLDQESGHNLQIDNPKLVARAIEEVAEAVIGNPNSHAEI